MTVNCDIDRRARGFTLVEMAIVLVIIGLILAAVSIGKDAERNAEYKKISQKFVGQWRQAYNEYYGRFHAPVGDDTAQPTLKAGGAAANASGSAANGSVCKPSTKSQGVTYTSIRCQIAGANLVSVMTKAGIKLPQGQGALGSASLGGGAAAPAQYVYLDQAGTAHTLKIAFAFDSDPHGNGGDYFKSGHINPPIGNLMRIDGVTPELAATLDNMYDGVADPTQGNFQCGPPLAAARSDYLDYQSLGDPNAVSATNSPTAKDEQRSTEWTCVWKMTS